ncbi:MAG: flagellar hook-length control protein FliK [Nitrospiraceae bacterium]
MSPLPQTFKSVTVDLDPLDMGPLRVRVMMAEQTVHTHIRTEHGVLGQGLVQQGHQLESSLRTTGLEMGFLRVTVDQQQQGRGDAGTGYQRPGQTAGRAVEGSAGKVEEADGLPTRRQVETAA